MVPRIALVSAQAALDLDEDMPPLVQALQRAGARVATPCWDDPTVEWAGFDVALLRSTWDYVERIDEFLQWARNCAVQTRLLNTPEVVAWNTDKHYLLHLHRSGVPVVPTRFVEFGEDVERAFAAFLAGGLGTVHAGDAVPFTQFVIKPSIGAGSRDAARYRVEERERALAHLRRLVEAGRRSAMLQPYLERVDEAGETALVYLGGRPSHAIRKGPLLGLDAGLVQGLFAPEAISSRMAGSDELSVAAAAFAAIPFSPVPLYARVDMIRDAQGQPRVLELELTEPSLFLAHGPGSADRLARLLLEAAGS
jgi:O-ureido-D-serine cyclo-ligase